MVKQDNDPTQQRRSSGGFQGAGRTLGSSSNNTAGNSPSKPNAEEVRRLRLARLAALENRGGGTSKSSLSKPKSKTPPPKPKPKTPPPKQKQPKSPPPKSKKVEEEPKAEEQEDEELRAALALSMRCPSETDSEDDEDKTQPHSKRRHSPTPKEEEKDDADATTNTEKSGEALSTKHLQNFSSIMWDTYTTTREDKSRWKNQGIHPSSSLFTLGDAAMMMDVEEEETKLPEEGEEDVLLQGSFKMWGLTQSHGGPCGVLAAVQAEMLRLLLFGVKDDDDEEDEYLYYPTLPPQNERNNNKEITKEMVKEAMAKSIGMILARAAVMPSLNMDEKKVKEKDDDGAVVRLVLPIISSQTEEEEKEQNDDKEEAYKGLNWQALEPWDSSHKKEETSNVEQLGVWIIHTPQPIPESQYKKLPQSASLSIQQQQQLWTDKPESKRQRNDTTTTSTNDKKRCRIEEMIALANAVSNFLLHGDKNEDKREKEKTNEEEEEKEKTNVGKTISPPLKYFLSPGGVMLLTLSLVESRGVDCVRNDMDDPANTLTSQFGHSSQELINLLLTGQAVSNVFDNTLTVSGALSCRGVQSRPFVGYLSLLESLRYCEVGGYYKSPSFPIWVVGSQNHFSVLFGDERCLKESKSDVLLEKCRRAFKAVEGGEENGFIEVSALGKVIDSLDLRDKVGGDNGVQTLAAALEVSGAGIILWDDFWKASSRLLTGASIESVLQEEEPAEDKPPLLLTQHGEPTSANASKPSTMESDEELAKFLAAEWGSQDQSVGSGAQAGQTPEQSSAGASYASSSSRQKSDEEIARELQAQWDAELDGNVSNNTSGGSREGHRVTFNLQEGTDAVSAIDIDSDTYNDDAEMTTVQGGNFSVEEGKTGDSKMSPEEKCQDTNNGDADKDLASQTARSASGGSAKQPHKLNFEKLGDSFPLYHYNGLRGGALTSFRVTRLTPEEAVGASIALSSNSGGGGHGGSSHGGLAGVSRSSSGGDLEDVVRTKWPSCVFNWGGKNPPFID